MSQQTAHRPWLSAAQALLGSAGVALLTYVCYRLGFDVATASLLDLIAIVFLSLAGTFGSAAIVAISAALSLNYFLVPPRFSLWPEASFDFVAVAAFLIVALVISRLLSKVRQSLREAHSARDQLRLAIDTIPALVWTARPDGSSEFSNQRWLEFTGLSREQAQDWGYTSAMHAGDYERLLPEWTASFASGEAIEDEARMRRADGEYRWFLHRAVPLRDEHGEIVNWYGTSTDIEDRKRAEEVLREQAQLLDLTHDTVFVRDVNDVITYWNRGAEELYGWTREEAVGKVSHELMQTVFPAPLEEITATLHRTGRWDGELIHSRRDGTRITVASRWSLQRDERGNPVGTLETNNDVTERRRAETALRESEERYRSIFEGAGVSIWEEDFSSIAAALDDLKARGVRDFRQYLAEHPEFVRQAISMVKIVDVNDATVKLLAAGSKEELLVSLNQVFLPETEEVFAGELLALWEGRTLFQSETVLRTLTGEKLAVLFTITFPPQPSKSDRVLVSIMDITDRRRAEEALRERASLLDLTHDTVFVRDMNDVITYWNRGAEELYGWSREQAVGKVSHELTQTIFPAPLEEITAALHRTGRWEGELVHTKRDGTKVTVASRWSLQRDGRGRPVATLETNNDITARKQAEEALRRSEAYLAEAQRLSRTGSFGWNVVTGEVFWSEETFRIFEYDPTTTTATVELGLRRIHPEDLPATRQLMERVVREGKDWESERRLLMPNGFIKYVHTVARATRDELGRLEFVGALMDVTAARQAEAELRRSEAYLAEAQRLSHTGSWAVNLQRPGERFWSAEMFRIFGLDPTTRPPPLFLGDTPPPFIHPEDWPKVQQAAEAAIRDKTNFEVHYRAMRPDGSARYLYAIGHPVVNAAGEAVELVGTVMDLTERRRGERALRRARERALKVRFDAVLDERTRLAREIHDTLLQGFTGVALQLVAVTNRMTGPPEITSALRDVVSQAQKTLGDARRAVWDLRTPSAGGDFPAALRSLAEESVRGTGLTLEYSVEGQPRPFDPDVEAEASRVAQEAITNVVKHAAASTVWVRLSFEPRGARLSVTDDGRGFTVDPDFQAYGGHWGLLGMRERATQIQGKLMVRSAPGQGTEVVLLVPYHARRRELTPSAATP